MRRSRGYDIMGCSEAQDRMLEQMAQTAGPSKVGVFDLDGCLFDTRHRQVMIMREYASRFDEPLLYHIHASHFTDWNLKTPLRSVGMSELAIERIYKSLQKFWWDRFFSDTYVRMDHALPGAAQFVRRYYEQGAQVVYLTGRDHGMRLGTEESLLACGFPYQKERTLLITKESFEQDDTEYKIQALHTIRELGEPVLFVDNEPSNVNAFKGQCPDALTVFIETDHSPRDIVPNQDIPWIRSFCFRQWHGDNWHEHLSLPFMNPIE